MKSKAVFLLASVLAGLIFCQPFYEELLAETLETTAEPEQLDTATSISAVFSGSSQETISDSEIVEEISEDSKESVVESTSGTQEETEAISEELTSPETSTVPTNPVQIIQPMITPKQVEENYQFSVVKNQTTEEFIQLIGTDAQAIAWNEGLYASVMIAQAILETGSGNSQLARPPHYNLFGIKGSYQGKRVNFATQEDNGSGQLYTIHSEFRQYPNFKESLEDYARLLKSGLSSNPSFYQGVWKEYAPTYECAAEALTGKYATDTKYDQKLKALIETYELSKYDQDPSEELSNKQMQEMENEELGKAAEEASEKTAATEEEVAATTSFKKQNVVKTPNFIKIPAKRIKATHSVK